jgi:hypothetical protein
MRAAPAAAAILSVISALAAGCDWRDFDELKKHTPVLTVGPDSDFPIKGDYGSFVLPLSSPAQGASGGRFLVSAASTAAIGVVDIDAQGQASNRSVTSRVFGTTNPLLPITAMAEVPGTRDVLLGAPLAAGTGSVYVFTLNASNDVKLLDSPADEDHFGLGVGAGALAGGPEPDYVVVSQFQVNVYLDGDATKRVVSPPPPSDCPLEISGAVAMRARLNRAVVVAPLEGAGAPQVIVGTPAKGGSGAVSVFRVDPTTGMATCAYAYRSVEERFGQALATGDFDGDKVPDLLVGAPPGKAYWIRGPLTMTSPLLPVKLTASVDSEHLGSSVGAANLDGQPGDEALVGDPGAKIGDDVNAGEVQIVTGTMPSGGMVLDEQLHLLRRHDPNATDGFGAQARALPFCTASCGTGTATVQNLVLVGAVAQTYTYFLLLPGDKDPRKP